VEVGSAEVTRVKSEEKVDPTCTSSSAFSIILYRSSYVNIYIAFDVTANLNEKH
jgi:hypothetical protein